MEEQKQDKKKLEEIKFSKTQILKSKSYADYKDLLNAVLIDEDMYTTENIQSIIKDFLGKRV